MYRSANDYYKEKYGCKVYKLSLDGGFTCPNRDGSVATGGCIFCSALGGGEFAEHGENISTQLEKAKLRVADKIRDGKYIAYFQSFTNTYGPTEVSAQIKALRDTGCTGGYMTWNANCSISKYRSLIPAFEPPEEAQ